MKTQGKPANFVRLFQPRFAPLVESGQKRQTVRARPKRMPKPGDHISLREWTGKPYRSRQRVLRNAVIDRVDEIVIGNGLWINGGLNSRPKQMHDFAHADGFANWEDLKQWFADTHGLPFTGILITW